MKFLVLGYGRMGRFICRVLSDRGHEVHAVDSISCSHENDDVFFHSTDIAEVLWKDYEGFSCVISSLPYFKNIYVARNCIQHNLNYVDLGGSVSTSNKIHTIYKNADCHNSVLTDMGLAPGLINCWADEGYQYIRDYSTYDHIDEIKMYVGGLPRVKFGILNYIPTWSIDGLLNEYKDDCHVILNGKKESVPGCSGYEMIRFGDREEFEAFNTSGGAAHSIDRFLGNVTNCTYKTLRYPGHIDTVKHWLEISEKSLREYLTHIHTNYKDMVLMLCKVRSNTLSWIKQQIIFGRDGWTAMQVATGTPVAIAAEIIGGLKGLINYNDLVEFYNFNDVVQECMLKYANILENQ